MIFKLDWRFTHTLESSENFGSLNGNEILKLELSSFILDLIASVTNDIIS